MRKKLVFTGLVLVLLTGAILFGSLVYITNMVLPKGSAEEFAALRGYDESALYQEEEKSRYGGNAFKASEYFKTVFSNEEFRHLIGGMQWVEDAPGSYVLCYVTQPSHELRELLQENPACKYMEVVLAKCDYSLLELAEAEKKFAECLASAPESLQDSVQFYMVMPRQNRVAVYVKDWSLIDQFRLASALGQDCGKFYLVEGDLMQTTKNITIDDARAWSIREQEAWEQRNEDEPFTTIVDPMYRNEASQMRLYLDELREVALLIYPEDDWRTTILGATRQPSSIRVDEPLLFSRIIRYVAGDCLYET